jgi:ABC-type transporter Mla MlaB component
MQVELYLPNELTIYSVSQLKSKWLSVLTQLSDGPPAPLATTVNVLGMKAPPAYFSVDAAAVTEVDSAGVQLLLALSNELAGMKSTLLLLNQSAPLSDALSALGLAALFGPTGEPEAKS